MTPENFVYWLQGYLEITNQKELDESQVKVIQEHLNLVLCKITHESVSSEKSLRRLSIPSGFGPRRYC